MTLTKRCFNIWWSWREGHRCMSMENLAIWDVNRSIVFATILIYSYLHWLAFCPLCLRMVAYQLSNGYLVITWSTDIMSRVQCLHLWQTNPFSWKRCILRHCNPSCWLVDSAAQECSLPIIPRSSLVPSNHCHFVPVHFHFRPTQ